MLGAVVVFGYLVSRYAFAERFPYFFDEGTYAGFVYSASTSLDELWVSMTIGREPLQIWLGIPWVEIGLNPLTAMRIVSVLSGLLTLPVLFLLGRRLADDWVGLTAAGLYAVIPFFLVHNGIGIMETAVTLVMAAALLLQIDLARRPSLRLGLMLGLVTAAGVLTKENTKPALALIPLSLILFDWQPEGRRERLTRWLGAIGIVAVLTVLADRLMRLSSYYDEFEKWRAGGFYTSRKLDDVLSDPFSSWGDAIEAYGPAFTGYTTVPLLIAFAIGAWLGLRRHSRLTLVLLGWIAVPLVISLTFAALPYPRHVMYLMPPAIVLMAYAGVEGVGWVWRRLPNRAAIAVAAAGSLVLLGPALWLDLRLLRHPGTGPYPGLDQEQYVELGGHPWQPVANAILANGRGERVVILRLSAIPGTLPLLLGPGDDRYVFVPGTSALASQAQFAVVDRSVPFGDPNWEQRVEEDGFMPFGHYGRPEGSKYVSLYRRPE